MHPTSSFTLRTVGRKRGTRRGCGWVSGEGGPGWSDQEAGMTPSPTPLEVTSLLLPGSGRPGFCPQPSARCSRAPDSTAPGAAPPWARARSCELDPAPLGPDLGYCIAPVWDRSGVFYTPLPLLPCAGVLTRSCPGATPTAGLHPGSNPSREPSCFKRKRNTLQDNLPLS